MADNSLTIADKKPLQKRYCATIGIFITLIIRILEDRFTNRILHEGRNVRQTANKCLQFFCFREKRGFMRRCRPETKETAFAAIGHFRFFVRMPAAAKRSDEHREANSAYLSESLSRAAKNRCAHCNLFHLTNAILTKARVAGRK